MTLVKVCGVNRPDDLAVAVEAGADLIGFILVDWSPRAITRAAAADLATQVPDGIGRVGVFVDTDPATVAAIADELALDYVQLHGSEEPAVVESFGVARDQGAPAAEGRRAVRHHHPARPPLRRRSRRPTSCASTGRWPASSAPSRRVLLAGALDAGERRRRDPRRPALGGRRRARHRVGSRRQGPRPASGPS